MNVAYLLVIVFAMIGHPGRTDRQGGHNVRATGGYHFHHGMPAHDHPKGICPYGQQFNTPNPPTYGELEASWQEQLKAMKPQFALDAEQRRQAESRKRQNAAIAWTGGIAGVGIGTFAYLRRRRIKSKPN